MPKKILALGFIGIFSLASFAGAPNALASTASCSTAGGHCVSGSCPSGETPNGDTCDGGETCCVTSGSSGALTVNFTNPLEYDTVENVLASLLDNLQGIIVVISIIFIIVGAILYITSTGDEKRITTAKAAITASIIGLAIGIAAPSFLREISDILGWTPTDPAVAGSLTLAEIALNALNFLLSVVGVLAIIMLVTGGIMYLTATGDEKRIDTAKRIVTWSIVGITVALAAMVIVRQIAAFFG